MTFRPSLARCLMLLVLLGGLFLAACQANEEIPWATVVPKIVGGTTTPEVSSSATAPVPQVSPTVKETLDEKTNLKGQVVDFWHPWQDDLAKRVEEAAAEFNRSNKWGITVKVKPFYNSWALVEAVSSGLKDKTNGLPSVVAAPPDQLAYWAGLDGAVIGLDKFLADPEYGFTQAEVDAFYPSFWSQDRSGSQRFAIPALRNAQVIFYNESWAKELGFTSPPKTPAEFKAQACAAAKKNNASKVVDKYGTGGWVIDNDALTTLSWMSVFGAQPIPTEDGKPYVFQGKEAEEALSFLRGMLNDGCAWLARSPAPYEYFSTRMALFYSGTLPDATVQTRWQEKLQSKDSWRILPFLGKDGKPVVYSSGYSYAVFQSTPENQLASWVFIHWLEQPTVAAKLEEALPSLPVSSAHAAQLKPSEGKFPWNMILPLAGSARPAPAFASWLEARRLVEDASYQIYRTPVEDLPQILPQLDQAIQEITSKK